jgi:uncharacterized alpha-E superfamily protein
VLNRVAEALYWIGRYVERAEDTARLLDVHFHEILEDPKVAEADACARLLTVMGVPADRAAGCRDGQALVDLLGYDQSSPNSIVGALVAARQNARGAREALALELWECLNATHHALPGRVAAARDFGPAPFFSYIRERTATFAGHAECIMTRDAGHDLLVLGRSLERVDMTTRLLAARVSARPASESWTATLRACSALDGYQHSRQGGVDAAQVVEFLLLDPLFPRSVWHALAVAEQALARLDRLAGWSDVDDSAGPALAQARAELAAPPAGGLLDDLPDRLVRLQQAVSALNEAATRRFFATSAPVAWSLEERVT